MSRSVAARSGPDRDAIAFLADLLGSLDDHDDDLLCELVGGAAEVLERALAEVVGTPYSVAVASGTAALLTSLTACDVGPGDEVIVSSYDHTASAAAVLRLGARPVPADVDPDTYILDPRSVASRLTARTRAVVVCDLFGQPAPIPALRRVLPPEVWLVEDACQALGASYDGHQAGSLADFGCFSFGWSKAVCGLGGGAIATSNPDLFDRVVQSSQHPLRQLRLGATPDPFYVHLPIHPFAALLALHQLHGIDDLVARRSRAATRLDGVLSDCVDVRPPLVVPGGRHAWHRYCGTLLPRRGQLRDREEVMASLDDLGWQATYGLVPEPVNVLLARSAAIPYVPCPVAELRCHATEIVIALKPPTPVASGSRDGSLTPAAPVADAATAAPLGCSGERATAHWRWSACWPTGCSFNWIGSLRWKL